MYSNRPLSYFASLAHESILEELHTTEKGLSEHEAEKRLRTLGYNTFHVTKKSHWLIELLLNFKNPLVLILLFASIVSFALHEIIEGLIIAIIVLFSTVLNFLQEYHAGKAAEKLKDKVATRVTVIREGVEKEIKISHVAIGDIVTLRAGDIVPADSRILSAKDFFVNQSSLTGESFPLEKSPDPVEQKDASLSDLTNIVFSGSNVISGTALALVIKTGLHTQFGEIANDLSASSEANEFTVGVKNFSLLIMRITIFFVLFIFFFNTVLKHSSVFESFTFAIAVAVGLTPELLPMIMSVTMAKGSFNMAKKGVIVKKLAAIPTFGEMNILCTDKTGTLTQDKIELVNYVDITGNHSEKVLLYSYINSFHQTGIKNPMDDAVLHFKKVDIHGYTKVDEIPFDFQRKKMSVVVKKEHSTELITKGAPEEIFTICNTYVSGDEKKILNDSIRKKIIEQYNQLSKDGFRVLAIATKEITGSKKKYEKDDEKEMSFLGFTAFLDPAKKDVKEVLMELERIGIEVKVITGDNELITNKICSDVSLPIKGVLTGNEIEHLSDEALAVQVGKTTIFARCSPDQKSRIIKALKSKGNVLGYMGDGINDAPSLKAADVGISVQNAVDVAKETADMILTHKSLRELKDGVLEGRKTFGNTMKYIQMGISSNFGNMFSVLGAVFFLPYLPMLPIQILLNNLMYDISQISIPTDNVDKAYTIKPKKWDIKFIKNFMFVFGPISSLFDFLTFFTLYVFYHFSASSFQTGWFLESLATQTLVIHIIRTRSFPFDSRPSRYLLLTTVLVVIIGWIIPYTRIGSFFGFSHLSFPVIFTLGFIVLLYLVIVEVGKHIFYRYNKL